MLNLLRSPTMASGSRHEPCHAGCWPHSSAVRPGPRRESHDTELARPPLPSRPSTAAVEPLPAAHAPASGARAPITTPLTRRAAAVRPRARVRPQCRNLPGSTPDWQQATVSAGLDVLGAPEAAHRREPETSILRHAIPEAVRDSYSTSGPSPDRNWSQPLSAAGRPVVPGLVDVSSGRSEEADGAGRVPDRARTSLVEDSAVSHSVARGGSVSTADAGCPSYSSPTASMTPWFPTPLPPYASASLLTTSRQVPA